MKTYSRKKQTQRYEFDDSPMDFNEICRLCLSDEGEKFQIYQDCNEVPLPLRIMACVSVEVFEGDGLPTQICQQCYAELDNHYRFKQKCENSDARLKHYLRNIKPFQFEQKVPEEINKEGNSTTCEPQTLLRDAETQEHEIIQNIRQDLENHKNTDVNSSPIDQNVNYKEGCDTNNETQTIVHIASSSDGYTQQPQSMTILQVKKEISDTDRSIYSAQQSSTQQHSTINTGQVMEMQSIDTLSHFAEQGLPFICSKCPKRFAKRIDLRRHESVHNQQRGFECPVCEKWFPNKTSFGRHERTHTGERPYSCSQCGKSFSQGAILARHIMTHTGIKPFKCEVCHKGFTQREGLRVHMRQHTKEQPEIQLHECPLCEKSFCHPSGLSRHLIIHTGKTFDCSVCPKVFTDSSSLRRHMKRHGDSMEPPLNEPPQEHSA